jgi:hypothetical protein
LQSFVEGPHAAIEGPSQGIVVNLTDHRAGPAGSSSSPFSRAAGPNRW